MWRDEILEEIYRIREEHARAFNYDLKAICDDLRKRQATSDRKIISKPLREPRSPKQLNTRSDRQ
ncbi:MULTISPECIES: hypothetical protein [unclassified Roseofilum]|uniref:hypothetical protein n=1 Tax=unclassified Roseofilum TaxID=2620099 RepID=UPI000E9CCC45|nr:MULTISPECIES: hypothetical protein [unclassified Roseofilum]MBP0006924.1 hypothetical protein [Roseofilum sp. Belize Diploria]MBP0032017.1 hypothetical protein [Roseofilum sp. Belize BBD 4]HBR00094.1 hypothetical protein [Cyanobacteria bacterium UBA11691]